MDLRMLQWRAVVEVAGEPTAEAIPLTWARGTLNIHQDRGLNAYNT